MTAAHTLTHDSSIGLTIGPMTPPVPSRWWAVQLTGELDLATGPDLDTRLERAIAQHPGDGIVLDLSRVTFMDCAGLRPLMRARARLGRRLCLRATPPRVLRFLTLAEVAGSLRILPPPEAWPSEADPQRCAPEIDVVQTERRG
jgi:anti-anti-sigma factor